MTEAQHPAHGAQDVSLARDARGRFQPGQSGNPAGKKPGTLNHATRIRQELEDGEFRIVARQLIDRAKDGELAAMRILLDRVDPKPRGRPVALNFPVGASVLERFMYLSVALAAGEITPDEARTVALVLDLEGRERQRTLNADLALAKNRDAYLPHELEQTAKRFDALFPVTVWNQPPAKPAREPEPPAAVPDAEPEPDLPPACMSEQAAPPQAPAREPSPEARGAGAGGDAHLHSTCISAPVETSPAETSPAETSPAETSPVEALPAEPAPARPRAPAATAPALHSTCKSLLPTPRRRAVNRWRSEAPGSGAR